MINSERFQEIKSSQWFLSVRGKLEHIQRFLHDGSASAMVGSGFSRNAERDANVPVKDWEGLALDFYKRLYGGEPDKSDLSLKSALRLASQVECQYGRNELERIIEEAVPNDKLKPGPLHIALVNLPWHDIFTTNYDQLLEKTPTRISYNLVTNKETLLYRPHPRIIKLHGSFPDIRPYIISEEDYRKYPDEHPEFVNTVRQSLIESALSLFGFSGDDPNFLNWIGWIRDKMGEKLAPIYLFDVSDKGYHESELSLLHKRRIEIISRYNSPFNSIDEYFEFIFQFLEENPAAHVIEWNATVPYDIVGKIRSIKVENGSFRNDIDVEIMKELLHKYRTIRETYPGWLFMPVQYLENAFEDSFSIELRNIHEGISSLPTKERKELLYELEWRIRMSFTPVSLLPWYAKEINRLIEGLTKEEIINDHQLVVLSISLMSYYRQRYEIKKFEKISELLADVRYTTDTEIIRRYLYERCLSAVSVMDYSKTQMIMTLWSPAPEDYLGVLWKSAIMVEIGEFEDAYSLLTKTYAHLQKAYMTSQNLNFIDSTMGAYESVIRLLEPFSDRRARVNRDLDSYRIYKYFRYEKGRLYDCRDKNTNNRNKYRTHEFNLNHVINHFSMGVGNRDSESQFAGRVQMVWESFGYPYLINAMTINTSMMKLSSDSLLCSGNAPFALNALIRSAQADTIKEVLSKNIISSININVLKTIFDSIIKLASATTDWNESGYGTRLSVAITQILRRFCVVLDAERIKHLVPILLQIRESRTRDYKNESLRTIYNCLSDMDLRDIYPKLVCAPIAIDELDRDIIFPDLAVEINVPDKAIEIIKQAFDNPDKYVRNNAYLRAARIIKNCVPNQQSELREAIRTWRIKDMDVSINATYSFNVVPFEGEKESISPLDRIEKSIDRLRNGDMSNQNADDDIVVYTGKAEDNLCVLEALVAHIPDEKQQEVAEILVSRLNKIIETTKEHKDAWEQAFGHHDKYELRTVSYVLARLNYNSINCATAKSACSRLIELSSKGYPKIFSIYQINKYAEILSTEEFEKILRNCILSSDEDIRKSAFDFMSTLGFDLNTNIWKLVWNKIQFSSSPEVANYLSLVMDTCDNHKLNLNQVESLPEILLSIKENTDDGSWLDGDIFDVQYQVLKLLGYLSNCEKSESLSKSIEVWMPNNEIPSDIPNDVRLGYEEGVKIWEKHNLRSTNKEQA